jgi:hypothetical protein
LSKKLQGAAVRLMPRGIDVEKSRPGARRELRSWGQRAVGLETPLPPEERPKSDVGEAAQVESRAPSPAPDLPATASDLPDYAKKADDLEEIKKAVEDAASVSGALWFSYLFVLFYFAIAAGAVTHADLFFENPVKLPLLGVDLPLLAFFFLAPILFVIIHAYILVHLVILTDRRSTMIRRFTGRSRTTRAAMG